MSSDRPSDDPSAAPEAGPAPRLARARGGPLLDALEERLAGSRDHAEGTASYAFATAVQLGLARDVCLLVREAARLHEVGRLYVRAALLSRPAAELSPRARRELHSHAEAGHRLARGAGVPEPACEWVLHSGERFDVRGEEVPLPSRIIAAACEYDALRRERGRGEAFIRLTGEAGARLDPVVVDALARVIERAAERVRPSAATADRPH